MSETSDMGRYETILAERNGNVGWLTLNRPGQFNTFSEKMLDELDAAVASLAGDPEVRVVVFTGNGKAFCAGVDLNYASSVGSSLGSYHMLSRLQTTLNRIADLGIPTIGAINGLALGGGFEMVLAFDFVIATEQAKFGVPEINVGVLPGGGGMSRLPKRLGTSLAKRLVLLGENLSTPEALAVGLLYKVVGDGDALLTEARALARALAGKPPHNLRIAKQVLDRVERMTIADAMVYEAQAAALLYDTEDRKEGMRAFLEKRKPIFTGG